MHADPAITAALVVLVSATACERFESAAESVRPSSESEEGTDPPPSVAEHMLDHFIRGVQMRDAVIAGDLEAMREDARWLAEDHFSKDNLPAPWRPHVTGMQIAANKALEAEELRIAAGAVAELAAACGGCHRELGGPSFTVGMPPRDVSDVAAHMARHRWAADRMWAALAMPSDEAWRRATEVMADAPLVPEAVTASRTASSEVGALARSVHDIAKSMGEEEDLEARISGYGRLLTTCASCHTALGSTGETRFRARARGKVPP